MSTNTILVKVSETQEGVRGGSLKRKDKLSKVDVTALSDNINIFVTQISQTLAQTPEKIDKFRLDEIEVHAEITAKGTLAILGTGGEIGGSGGLRFVFRRSSKASS